MYVRSINPHTIETASTVPALIALKPTIPQLIAFIPYGRDEKGGLVAPLSVIDCPFRHTH
jgi:hypothetical protein